MKNKKIEKQLYKLTLKINDKEYTETGKTVFGALKRLYIPELCSTVGIIKAQKGKKITSQVFNIQALKMLKADNIRQKIVAKQWEDNLQ